MSWFQDAAGRNTSRFPACALALAALLPWPCLMAATLACGQQYPCQMDPARETHLSLIDMV